MAKQGPEGRLIDRAKKTAFEKYGDRLVWIKHHGGPHATAGVSDLLLCLDGVFVAIEMKAPENYSNSVFKAVNEGPTLKQRAFIDKVRAAGGVGGYAASVEGVLYLLAVAEDQARGSVFTGSHPDFVSGNL